MASTKSKTENKNDKKTENKNKNAGAKSPPKTGSESTTNTAKVTRKLLDKLSPIGATTRAALRSLATDAQRSDLGRQTKARGVLADGISMAISIGGLMLLDSVGSFFHLLSQSILRDNANAATPKRERPEAL